MANFTGRLAPAWQKTGSRMEDAKLATSPLVLATYALRACDV
jgi:hypothetical protein